MYVLLCKKNHWKSIIFCSISQNYEQQISNNQRQANASNVNKMKLFWWFKQQGGKEKSPLPKPYLTEDQKKERVTWCKEVKDIIKKEGKNFYAVFLDEKWFYPTSRRRKLKILPKTEGEDHEDYQPTERRRSNNIKVSKPAPLDCWFVFLIHLR